MSAAEVAVEDENATGLKLIFKGRTLNVISLFCPMYYLETLNAPK